MTTHPAIIALVKALKPFAETATVYDDLDMKDDWTAHLINEHKFDIGDLRRAAKAYALPLPADVPVDEDAQHRRLAKFLHDDWRDKHHSVSSSAERLPEWATAQDTVRMIFLDLSLRALSAMKEPTP